MTPLYNKLIRFISPAKARIAIVVIYATLLILIVTFLVRRRPFDLIYLDLGR